MTPFLSTVARCEFGGAAAAAAVWALTRLAGRHLPPRWRYHLWLLVLLRLCLPVLPTIPVHLPRWTAQPPAVQPLPQVEPAPPETAPDRVGPVRVDALRLSSATDAIARPSPPFDPIPLLLRTWAAVAAVLLARLTVQTVRASRLVRSYPPLADAGLLAEWSAAADQLGLRPPPALVAPAGTGPAVTGLLRPRLLLPADLAARLPPDARRLVLLHELAHVRRRDVPVGWLASAVAAIHWFNPAAWLALSQLRTERELAADAAVLDATGDRATYGDTLVRLVRANLSPGPAAASAMAEPAHALHRRIAMIARHRRPSRLQTGLAITLGLAVGLVTCLWTQAADPTSKPAPTLAALATPGRRAGPATTRLATRFEYAGQVLDGRGQPIAGAQVTATDRMANGAGFGYIDVVQTDAAGRFSISRDRVLSGATPSDVRGEAIRLSFVEANHAYAQIDDVGPLGVQRATHLRVTLGDGRTVTGRTVGPDGRPVAGALVQVRFGDDYDLRRATVSDAAGGFQFRGMPDRAGAVLAWTIDPARPALAGGRPVGPADADLGAVPLVALPAAPVEHALFGLRLLDVDPPLQKAFGLYHPDGILVLDAGPNPQALGIGRLQRGDTFWIVGQARVANFAQFRLALLAASGSLAVSGTPADCRVVYEYDRPDGWGSMTAQITLNRRRVAELKAADGPAGLP